ncbi:MAG: alpha/beta hydrolase [Firmicutes bacterium]|nr:alpha/beta hydrolase [Bacillota bacterium]HPU01603.1 alpha/beta hydrolase [Bacillota bacterium]
MPRVEIMGRSYFYAGTPAPGKPALLFCHGAGGSHRHWLYQLEGLKGVAATLAVDLPGHGDSEGEPAAEIDAYREFLRRFCAALGLEQPVLAGHSMGGAVALDYALHFGDSLRGLIIVASGARLRVAPSFLEAARSGQLPAEMIDYAYGPAAPAELLEQARREMAGVPPQTFFADFTACSSFDFMERLSEIKPPVLLICGREDRMTPPKFSRYMLERLPRAEMVEVECAGHMVMLETPQKVNEAIASFLKQIGAA